MITHFTYYRSTSLITLRVSTAQEMMKLVRSVAESDLQFKGGFWHIKSGPACVDRFRHTRYWPEFVTQYDHWINQMELWHGEEEEEAEAED